MANYFENVFSEYTITGVAFRPAGTQAYVQIPGAGSMSEEYEQRSVTKSVSNIVVKRIPRSSGSGTLTVLLHVPYELKNTLQGLTAAAEGGFIAGVYGAGGKMRPPVTEIAVKVEDEDGNVMYKYYPAARRSSFNESVTSEQDTVAEVEMQFNLSEDDYRFFRYSALEDDLPTTGEITKDTWMTAVSSAKLQSAG